jgi:hypothetical protein
VGIPQETLAALHTEHGEVWTYESESATVAFRCPTGPEWKRFVSTSARDQKMAPEALERLAASCIVWPSPEQYAALVDRRPGLALSVGDEVAKVARDKDPADARKYKPGA